MGMKFDWPDGPVDYIEFDESVKSAFISDVLSACQWMRIMLDDVKVVYGFRLTDAKYFHIPNSDFDVILVGDWVVNGVCKLLAYNKETRAACSIEWKFLGESTCEVHAIHKDIRLLITALKLMELYKDRRYCEVECIGAKEVLSI